MVKVKEDLIGKIFGRLKVIEQVEDYIGTNGKREAKYRCVCSCGNDVIVHAKNLKTGLTTSCGCLQKETTAKASKKHNQYYIENNIVYIKLSNCNEYTCVNLDKWNEILYIKEFCWYKSNKGYAFARVPTKYKKDFKAQKVCLHQLICHCVDGFVLDHYDRNRLNNLTHNISIKTQQENNQNSSKPKNNTSGIIGVHWDKKSNKWRSQIQVDGESIYLGLFNNKEDALTARLIAEKKYFGLQAPQRDLFERFLQRHTDNPDVAELVKVLKPKFPGMKLIAKKTEYYDDGYASRESQEEVDVKDANEDKMYIARNFDIDFSELQRDINKIEVREDDVEYTFELRGE